MDWHLSAALTDFLTGLEQLPAPQENLAATARARIAELAQMSFTALGRVFPMTDENGRWTQWLTPNLREDLVRLRKVLAANGSLGGAGFYGSEGWASFDLTMAKGALGRGDHAERLRRLRMAAWKDSPEAMMALATAYREGQGAPADPALALRWLALAVTKLHAPAFNELATWFEKGWGGLTPDKAQVNSWRYHARQLPPPISRTARIVKERDQWKYDAYMSGNWEFRLQFNDGTRHTSHVRMSAQGGGRFQLDYDLRAPRSHTTQAWTTEKQYASYDARTYPVLNFDFAGRPFTGAFTQGALNGRFSAGTWVGSRRFDLDYFDLAEQATREGRVDDALHYYTEAIKLSLGEDIYHQRRSGVYYGMGDHEAALADVNEALRRKPGNFTSLFNRALVHHELRNYQEAVADATAGLAAVAKEATPDLRARLLRTRARAQFAGGSAEEAVKDYAEARKIDPNAPQTRDEMLAGMHLANKAINETFSKLGEHTTKLNEEMRKLEADRRKQNEAAAKLPPSK